ncbi:MAG: hypothetical protein QXG39_00005, partial [Candidatus Aenigmatarchaeota archaeon]
MVEKNWVVRFYGGEETISPERLEQLIILKGSFLNNVAILLSEYKKEKRLLDWLKDKNVVVYVEKENLNLLLWLSKNYKEQVDFSKLVFTPSQFFAMPLRIREKFFSIFYSNFKNIRLDLKNFVWEGNISFLDKLSRIYNPKFINYILYFSPNIFTVEKAQVREKSENKKDVKDVSVLEAEK